MKKKEGTSQMEGRNAAKEGLTERNGSVGEKRIWREKHREKTGGKQKWRTAVKQHNHTLGISRSK